MSESKKSSRLNPKKQDKVQVSIDQSWSNHTVDLALTFQQRINEPPRVLKGVTVYRNSRDQIVSYLLVDTLKSLQFCRQDSSISVWDSARQVFVFAFNITRNTKDITRNISPRFVQQSMLRIKIRGKRKLIVDSLIEQQRLKYQQDQSAKQNKQKKIGQVVEKVALWRKFYTGFYDQFGNYIQKPLENAAQQVGIAKKTLDDYLLQIRSGKKYGFNFNDKVNSKIGELRAFVRDEKKKQQGK